MSDKPHRIAVLMGGLSAEREVSLKSGAAVSGALSEAGFEVTEVLVDDNRVPLPAGIDMAFLAMHGTFAEDGQIQDLLSSRGMPYTGANADVSRIAFNKEKTKERLRAHGVPTPEGQLVRQVDEVTLALPVFIKPNAQGSSVGSRSAATREELAQALTEALKFDSSALVERLIFGRELTVGVLGDRVLPIIEIHPLDGFYDYTNKYTKGRTEYFCPADLPEEITQLVQRYTMTAHQALGGAVYSRVDFLLEQDGSPLCLEVNTIPGMTATSLLPKAAAAVGLTFPQLCQHIIELSWAERQKEGLV